ncbi:TauD/TfdA dioxygenase family protein [Streptomyces lydicus]|uniref:TauD/TfdA dioxygenase family protein n=1 Tax=Streptomyces lydicus TaxID=47763 RepID=UPI001F505BC9|nr:TauD/TfdA family dioxygenase [Streptomyces lydicus]MCZ1012217.1 TauD/TfdA family dioxygenase [Streptomyces lydicus]
MNRLSVVPLAGHIGAQVEGVDLSEPLDEPTRAEIWAAVLAHKVLFFPGQQLDHAAHLALGQRFGALTRRPAPHSGAAPDGFPELLTVDTKVPDPRYGVDFEERYRLRWLDYTAGWHTDLTPAVNPPAASILRAERVTSFGGDTQWTNLEAAYAHLSPALRDLADGLRAEHAFFSGCQMLRHDPMDHEVLALNAAHPMVAEHPVVRVHPETGNRSLFVNPTSANRICGFSPAQSRELLALFFEQITRPEFTVRWRWSPGDVAFWDNRSTAHLSPGDAGLAGERRTLYRVTLLGDIPIGPDGTPSAAVAGDPFTALPVRESGVSA